MDELEESSDIDTEKAKAEFMSFWKKLTLEHLIIILLLMLMLLMYVIQTKEIDNCIAFYQNLLKNTTRLNFPII